MILVLGHVARVHPTANSLSVPFAGTNPESAPNFPVTRHPAKTLREPPLPACRRTWHGLRFLRRAEVPAGAYYDYRRHSAALPVRPLGQ